jgi:hypothetical protein
MAMIPIIWVLVLGCAKRTSQTTRSASDTIDLGDYQWKNRILLVFAESDERPEYNDFMDAWLQAQEGVEDRDLLVFQVLIEGRSKGPRGPLTPKQGDDLRKRFATAGEPFGVVLIGKDGGVKLRSSSAGVEQVFRLIDTMPMRRAEMREQESRPKE